MSYRPLIQKLKTDLVKTKRGETLELLEKEQSKLRTLLVRGSDQKLREQPPARPEFNLLCLELGRLATCLSHLAPYAVGL